MLKISKVKSTRKQPYFLQDDLEPAELEKRNRYRALVKENKELDDESQMTIKMVKGQITVNNEIIRTKIKSPTVPDILRLTDDELDDIKAVKLIPADEFMEKGSEYYSYVHKVRSVKDVNKGLMKARIKHGDATHVSCGYRLDNAIGPFNQEGHDDKEYGSGRAILDALQKAKLQNICVIIVRYFGGVRLGNRRFQILRQLTDGAIQAYQKKARDIRARQFRANSQDSIQSTLSALSYQHDEIGEPASDGETDDMDYATPASTMENSTEVDTTLITAATETGQDTQPN